MTYLHRYLEPRLRSMHRVLMEAFHGGDMLSNSSRGSEREHFVRLFLSQMFSPMYRFGAGDVTDAYQNRSGQVDVVFPFPDAALSFPMYPDGPRLYFADGVAAVIEVKSNLANQWGEVQKTAQKIKTLKRQYFHDQLEAHMALIESCGSLSQEQEELHQKWREEVIELRKRSPPPKIPVIAVGYQGWKTLQTIGEKIEAEPAVDCVLSLDPLCFRSKLFETSGANDIWALLEFLRVLERLAVFQAERSPVFVSIMNASYFGHLRREE